MNYRKTMIAGATAAVIVGAGGTALAVTGDTSTTSGSASTSGTTSGTQQTGQKAGHKRSGRDGKLLRRLEHGVFTVKGKDGKPVTRNLILGTVTSVSATSITVQAADKTSETFTVTKDTKVTVKAKGEKAAASTIDKVAKGAHVVVSGTGATKPTAVRVLETPAK